MCQKARLHHNQRVECPHCPRVIVRRSLASHLMSVHNERERDALRLADEALPPDRSRKTTPTLALV